ncbi:MAG: phage baseplate assembly protein V [Polyangiaceae bacterium]
MAGSATLVKRYRPRPRRDVPSRRGSGHSKDTRFRTAQSAWPRIYGFENGTVDGPGESQYAQIDDQGRYLVRFKFDTSDLPDGSTSTYLRMMQPHGGTTEGWHFPLRKGTEVMVSFQGGDPDRPVIAGVVPNAVQPSNVTSKNYTQNVLRTGGGSYIVLEDQEGERSIDTFVPVNSASTHRTRVRLGHNKINDLPIPSADPFAADEEMSVYLTYELDTSGSAAFQVGGSWWQQVGRAHILDVGAETRQRFGGDHTFSVGGNSTELFNGDRNVTVKGAYSEGVIGHMNHSFSDGWTAEVTGAMTLTVTDTWQAKAVGAVTVKSDASVTVESPHIILKSPDVTILGTKVQTKSGWWKGVSGPSAELYTMKESAGIQKYDACSVSISMTGFSASLTGSKGESAGSKKDSFGMVFTQAGSDIKQAGAAVYNGGAKVISAGISVFK